MIVTFEDIKKVRPIANNINDVKRIEPYIREVEILNVLPVIGASLYKQLDELPREGTSNITNNENQTIGISETLLDILLNGGYYSCAPCGCDGNEEKYNEGLISAVAYLAYSRFLPNNAINVTAFGNVNKLGELSQPIDEKSTVRASKEAEKIGLEYLRQCVEFMKCSKIICETKRIVGKRKFKIIGD